MKLPVLLLYPITTTSPPIISAWPSRPDSPNATYWSSLMRPETCICTSSPINCHITWTRPSSISLQLFTGLGVGVLLVWKRKDRDLWFMTTPDYRPSYSKIIRASIVRCTYWIVPPRRLLRLKIESNVINKMDWSIER